jgi:hypothetical protein
MLTRYKRGVEDLGYSVIETSEGGYVMAGESHSSNDNATSVHRGLDFRIVKLGLEGNLIWQKGYGGNSNDYARSVIEGTDGSLVVAGTSQSDSGDVSANHGRLDFWVIKLNSSGSLLWSKSFGGSNDDQAFSVIESSEGDIIIAGSSQSNDGDVGGNKGGSDFWVVRLNSSGSLVWSKNFGGSENDYAHSVIEDSNGNLIVCGSSQSSNGDITSNNGNSDYWIIKLDLAGNLIWSNNFGGSGVDIAHSVIESSNGNYVVAGSSQSDDGDVANGLLGTEYAWVVQLSPSGTLVWQTSYKVNRGTEWIGVDYSGNETNRLWSINPSINATSSSLTAEFSFRNNGWQPGASFVDRVNSDVYLSQSDSFVVYDYKSGSLLRTIEFDKSYQKVWRIDDDEWVGFDYSGNETNRLWRIIPTTGTSNLIVEFTFRNNSWQPEPSFVDRVNSDVYLSQTGGSFVVYDYRSGTLVNTIEFDKSYQKVWRISENYTFSVTEDSDGGFVVAGTSNSSIPRLTGSYSDSSIVAHKLSSSGDLVWSESFGGNGNDYAQSIIKGSDGSFIVAGASDSRDGDLTANYGGLDFWIVKLKKRNGLEYSGPSSGRTSNALIAIENRRILYNPDQIFSGADSFSYVVSDGNGGIATGTVSVTVTPASTANTPPIANPDTATTAEDSPVTIDVLANDTDNESTHLTMVSYSNGANGFVTPAASGLRYYPNSKFNGTDSFTYIVSDGSGGTASGIVSVNVVAAGTTNTAPVANADTAITLEDTPVTIDVLSNDTDNETTSLVIVSFSLASNGSVAPVTGGLQYAPNANFHGSDSFTYTVSDGHGGHATAAVSLTITSDNDTPLASNDYILYEPGQPVDFDVLRNDVDPDGDSIDLSMVTSPTYGGLASTTDGFQYTPNSSNQVADSFVYSIKGSTGLTATGTVNLIPVVLAWNKTFGEYRNRGRAMIPSSDGGLVLAGGNYSVIKLDLNGRIVWENTFGGNDANAIVESADGGFAIAGTYYFPADPDSGTQSHHDYWVVRLDALGNLVWQKGFGGSRGDYASSIAATTDGGFVIAGHSNSTDGDINVYNDGNDNWIIKIDSVGNIVWQTSFEGYAQAVVQSDDDGFVVAGYSVTRLNASGDIIWQTGLGGGLASAVGQIPGGGFAVAGYISVQNGDWSHQDFMVAKLDAGGRLLWKKNYGGTGNHRSRDQAYAIRTLHHGGLVVAGKSESNNGDVSGNHGQDDYWVIRLDKDGYLLWQKSFGGSDSDVAYSLANTSDGGFAVAGQTRSNNGDVSGNQDRRDLLWVLKFYEGANLAPTGSFTSSILDEDITTSINVIASATDPDGDQLYLNLLTTPSNGSASITTSHWVGYKPNAHFNGVDALYYKTTDGKGGYSDDLRLLLTVNAVDDAPYLINDRFSVWSYETSFLTPFANDTEVDGQTLSFSVTENTTRGNLALATTGVNYTPNTTDSGVDGFVYEASDSLLTSTAQADINIFQLEYSKTFGGSGSDQAVSMIPTADSGIVIAGNSGSNDGDVTGNHGGYDFWIIRLDAGGNMVWESSFGGSGYEYAGAITASGDGGFAMIGHTDSNDGQVSGNHGDHDFWVVRLDAGGKLVWQKTYGGSEGDHAYAIADSGNGGFMALGYTRSSDGDVIGANDYGYGWVLKLDDLGFIQRQAIFQRHSQAMIQSTDGGFITLPNPITKLDTNLNIVWEKSFGTGSPKAIIHVAGGGFAIAGSISIQNEDYSSHTDYMIAKLDSSGALIWQKNYGGTPGNNPYSRGEDQATSIFQTKDGGFVIAGYSNSNNGDVSGNHGENDCWVIKLDSNGNLLWEKSFGGSRQDDAVAIIQNDDGSFTMAGSSESNDGDVVKNDQNNKDYWVIKFKAP